MTHSHKKLSKHSRKKSLKRSHSPSKNITRQIFFYFVDGPFEHRLNVKEQSIVHAPNSTLYVLGDMEGNIVQLYQWFLHKKLITKNLEWIGKNTYVIQCGDQVDSIRFEKYGTKASLTNSKKDTDLGVPIFLEYMNYISKGKVLSVIGNHEWMNVFSEFGWTQKTNCIHRKLHFAFNGIIGKIFRRRNFVIQFNNCLLSHAGVSPVNIQKYKQMFKPHFKLSEFIQDVNYETNLVQNYTSTTITPLFKEVVYGSEIDNNLDGICWNRHFTKLVDKPNYKGELKQAPELKDFIQIKGHDKGDDINFCSANSNKVECSLKPDLLKANIITVDTEHAYTNNIVNVKIQFDQHGKPTHIDSEKFHCDTSTHVPFSIKRLIQHVMMS